MRCQTKTYWNWSNCTGQLLNFQIPRMTRKKLYDTIANSIKIVSNCFPVLTTENDVDETLLPHRGIHYVITATTCLSPISCQEVGVPSVKAAAVATSSAKSSCTTECKVKLIAHFQYNYRVLNWVIAKIKSKNFIVLYTMNLYPRIQYKSSHNRCTCGHEDWFSPSFDSCLNPIPIRRADYTLHILLSTPSFETYRHACNYSSSNYLFLGAANKCKAKRHVWKHCRWHYCFDDSLVPFTQPSMPKGWA